MSKICKMLLAAAAVAALAAPAMAADKLIVKNAAGTADVFKVDDNGSVTAGGGLFLYDAVTKKLGSGLTAGHAPEASFHITDSVGTADRGLIVGQHNTGAQAANVQFRKSRGTDLAPTTVISGDFVGAFHGIPWDGSKYVTTATVNFIMDGAVTTTSAPQAMIFSTGQNANGSADPLNKTERLRITSTGNVVIANKAASSVAAVMPVDATVGFMYVPTVNGTLTTCATITQYVGHAPLWIDVVGNKVCTCNGTALKCTAAMN